MDNGVAGDVTSEQLWILLPAVIGGLALAVSSIKPLNMLLAGEEYARSMGMNPRRSRALIFTSTTLFGRHGHSILWPGRFYRAGHSACVPRHI